MERVYKSIMGYKPENEKNSATHIILTLNDFNALESEIKHLRAEIKETVRVKTIELEKFQENTNKSIEDIKKQAQERFKSLQNDLGKAKEEIDRVNNLNANLKRVMRERANSKRGLKPKKIHHGYMVLDSQQYTYFHNNKGSTKNFPCWKVRIQSPYDSSIPYGTITKDIYNDLVKIFGSSLGINLIYADLQKFTLKEVQDLWDNEKNFIFKTSYKANIKSGLWEIEYLVKSSITIPEDMRIAQTQINSEIKRYDFYI